MTVFLRLSLATFALILAGLLLGTASAQIASVGGFLPLPSMSRGASSPSAVKLLDGRALVVGFDTVGHVFDPATGSFTETGPLAVAHPGATMALLPSGKVLLASGALDLADRRAELYDPATNAWTLTSSMAVGRKWAAVLKGADGRIYFLGGEGVSGVLASVERYDATTGQFTAAGTLTVPRARSVSLVLADGRFLLAGGMTGANVPVTSANLYNPTTLTAVATGGMAFAHVSGTGVRLLDGRILITGGTVTLSQNSVRVIADADIYRPASGTFVPAFPMIASRIGHSLTLLPGGRVLVTGGLDDWNTCSSYSEVYDPAEPSPGPFFRDGPRMPVPFCRHATVTLDDGTALFAGGSGVQLPSGAYEPSERAMLFNPWYVFADGMGETVGP